MLKVVQAVQVFDVRYNLLYLAIDSIFFYRFHVAIDCDRTSRESSNWKLRESAQKSITRVHVTCIFINP